ncbi:MAG: bifunctional methylenetetrahydrofolate dehydrogenase/methenyltetrahydrofolate cyclohydrolase, partial [Butyrivibrio sp.]|nr:bifunctional methylenetetrahydrofolate dehydrogenase/methenyltetrahydrofolate cyclohydrolase [Butyrivibrio sp.]
MAIIIDGKAIANSVKEEIRQATQHLQQTQGITPTLAVVLVGEDPASQVYVRNKKKACEFVGFRSISHELPATTTQEELLA